MNDSEPSFSVQGMVSSQACFRQTLWNKESHDRAGRGLWYRRSGGGKVPAAAKSGSCMVSTVES